MDYGAYNIYNIQNDEDEVLCVHRDGAQYWVLHLWVCIKTQNFNVLSRDLPRIIRGAHTLQLYDTAHIPRYTYL